jgi:hypothetical protein
MILIPLTAWPRKELRRGSSKRAQETDIDRFLSGFS